MNNLFGISFSGNALHWVHTRDNKLIAANTVPYPFAIEMAELFSEKSIEAMAAIIQDAIRETDLENVELSIALPSHFAFIKKVAVPQNEEHDVVVEQMKWDLRTYLPDKLENYKVIKTDIEYEQENYKEILVICINKSIIQRLIELAGKAQASLKELLLDTFSLERFLKTNNYLLEASNTAVFKLDTMAVKTDLYINGTYYLSFSEPLRGTSHDVPLEERILDITKQHFGQIESHLSFVPFAKNNEVQLLVHGSGLNEDVFLSLQNAFSQELTRIPSPDKKIDNLPDDNFSLEALGVVNYRINI